MMTSSKKWRESDTVKFVELYEKAECLWNYRHPGYKHRNARDKAIQHMIDQMGLPDFGVNELKNKIKNIRSTYQQEVNKIRRSKQGFSGDILEEYKTNLAWFPIAHRFLATIINGGKSSLPKSEDEDNTLYYQQNQSAIFNLVETEMTNGDNSNDFEEKVAPFTISIDQIKEEIIDGEEYTPPVITSVSSQPKKRKSSDQSVRSVPENLEIIRPEEFKSVSEDLLKDEWYYFGNNISCQLRSLPLETALVCQKKIMDILTEERLVHILKCKTEENKSKPISD